MTRLAYSVALGSLLAYFFVANVASSRPRNVNAADSNADPIELATSTGASYNWAGYVAGGGTYTAISATWVVPQVQYPPGTTADIAADATWVGIGGVESHDLIQAGTQALVDSSGNTQYQAWYEALPNVSQPVTLDVEPGDSVSVALTYTGNGLWHVSFIDNTTGKRAGADVAYNSNFSSAEWIEEMPSLAIGRGRATMPLDNFTRVRFTGAMTIKDGQSETLTGADAVPLMMQTYMGDMLAAPSVISSPSSFSVLRGSALATAPAQVHVIIIGP